MTAYPFLCGGRAFAFLAAALLLLALPAGCGRAPEKPHILIITLDTTRADHLSCYGYERKTSPNLDALAAEGTLYRDCLSVTSWTLPSHASLFTGLYPCTHRAHYNVSSELNLGNAVGDTDFTRHFRADGLGEQAETLAETLARNGYATAAVCAGPWLKATFGLAQGFGFYDCSEKGQAPVTGRRADAITNSAISVIRKHVEGEGDRPLFLFLNYFDPHSPYSPPGRFAHAFSQPGLQKAAAYDDALKIRYHRSQYDGEILYMDEYIGFVFDELKRLELWEETWVIVTADHGEHFGEHGLQEHGFALFQETLHVPLIIKPPSGWDPIGDGSERVQLVHIMPTILDRLGIEPVAPLDAPPIDRAGDIAAAELYRNDGNTKTRKDGARYDRDLTAIFRGSFKMVFSTRTDDGDAGLFDLAEDPGETNNLEGSIPDRADWMRDTLGQWRRSLTEPIDPLAIEEVDEETRKQLDALGY